MNHTQFSSFPHGFINRQLDISTGFHSERIEMILLYGDPGVQGSSGCKEGIVEMGSDTGGSDKQACLIENMKAIFFGFFPPFKRHDKKMPLIISENGLKRREVIREIDLVFDSRGSMFKPLADGLFDFSGYFDGLMLFFYYSFKMPF